MELITITKEAADTLNDIAKKEKKEGYGLKIEAFPGGCAGIQYAMDFAEKPDKTDKVLEQHGLKIFIDVDSSEFIKGSKIDYIKAEGQEGFKIDNPNIKSGCAGCSGC